MIDYNENNNGYNNTSESNSYSYNNNYGYNQGNGSGADPLRNSSYYSESYRKTPRKKGNGLFQLIAVALISSILGGTTVGVFFQFVVPSMSPAVRNYFSNMIPGAKQQVSPALQPDAAGYKKVEIVQNSDSPVVAIAEKVSPSIVGIRSTFKASNFFFGSQNGGGEGSGIILKSDGYILTNFHVIQDSVDANAKKVANGAKIEVILPTQKDKPFTAKVVGYDVRTDLAVIKIEATNLPAAELGDSGVLKVGEMAVAIGNPGGLEYMGSVSVGIISGLNRTIQSETGKELKLIQTDTAINPGNSGGALVNSRGQVIGVNSIKIAAEGFEGLGFAIPINDAKRIADDLMQFTYVTGRPILGVVPDTRFNEEVAKRYKVPIGVLVAEVSPLSGAYKAGIQAGDIITKFDGKPVKNRTELDDLRNKHKVGDTVSVEVYRDGDTKTFEVKLGEDKG